MCSITCTSFFVDLKMKAWLQSYKGDSEQLNWLNKSPFSMFFFFFWVVNVLFITIVFNLLYEENSQLKKSFISALMLLYYVANKNEIYLTCAVALWIVTKLVQDWGTLKRNILWISGMSEFKKITLVLNRRSGWWACK